MKLLKIGRKGQFSWAWTLFVGTFGFIFTVWYWIFMDDIRAVSRQPFINAGADGATMAYYDTLFSYAPFVILISWAMFTLIVATATRGGDQI